MTFQTIDEDGTKRWYTNNKIGRPDGPAIQHRNGAEAWWLNGELHRVGGPAIRTRRGCRMWYFRGKLHCVEGPAIIFPDGSEEWSVHGKLHRLDGPAISYKNDTMKWYVNGQPHRTDGPAVVVFTGDGDSRQTIDTWYLNGSETTKEKVVAFAKVELFNTIIAMLPLDLLPYVLLWIMEFYNALLAVDRRYAVVCILEGLRDSRQRILDGRRAKNKQIKTE